MATDSTLSVLVNIFASPNEAFVAIKERPRAALPLLLLFVGICAVSFLYMTHVDLAWFLDAQMQVGNATLTEAQRNQAVTAAMRLPPSAYGAIGAISSVIFIVVLLALSALYYAAVSFFTADGVRYRQWFAFGCWCTMPALLGIVAQLVHLLSSDVRFMMQDAINPLAFGNIFGIKPVGVTIVQRILLGLDITTLWSIALTVLGYHAFTKSSIVKSTIIVLGPIAAIVFVTTAITLFRT